MSTATNQALPATMQAVRQLEYGLSALESVQDQPVPSPGKGQVLVRVAAAGVSRAVWHLSVGRPVAVRLATGLRRPRRPVPGLDLAGTVVAVGPGVTEFVPGDEVLGLGKSTWAQWAVAPVATLVLRPQGLSVADAAALPDSGGTALQAVRDHARVRQGERVLVIGASGGVGCYAVQWAVAAGATVTAVASAGKLDFVRGLGASEVIDHRTEGLDARGGDYDVVLDIAGNRPLRQLRDVMTPRGRLVIVGGEQGGPLTGGLDRQLRARMLSAVSRQRMGGMLTRPNRDTLTALVQGHLDGVLRSVVITSAPLAQGSTLLADLEAGLLCGKAVVTC